MEGLVSGAFAEFLETHRAELNAQFAQAKQMRPNLDPDAFKDVLRATVAPIVAAVAQRAPDATRTTALALYAIALDLLGQDFIGATARAPVIAQGWRELLPEISHHLASAPRAVIGAVTNALYNLAQTPGARPHEWLATMRALAPVTNAPTAFLRAGQIAAWRAGLAYFRVGALDLCKQVEPAIARVALGIPATNALDLATILARVAADPWLNPAAMPEKPGQARALKIVARVGAFRGLGGLFQTPPRVATAGAHFVVQDGTAQWLLVADCFGATFHRVEKIATAKRVEPFALDARGKIARDKVSQTFPELADHASAAANSTTLAVTSELSFAVSLIALVEN